MKNLLIFFVALCLMGSTSAVLATEFSLDGVVNAIESESLIDYLVLVIANKYMEHPVVALTLTGLSLAMPFIGWLANQTKNPVDNAVLIFINKLLQTFVFNTSKNQPDVLSWKELLTNSPMRWSALTKNKKLNA